MDTLDTTAPVDHTRYMTETRVDLGRLHAPVQRPTCMRCGWVNGWKDSGDYGHAQWKHDYYECPLPLTSE